MDPASIIIRSRPYWRGNATVFKVPRPQRTCSTQAVSAHPHDEQSFNPVVCSPIRRPRPRSHSYILPYILGQRGDSLRACRWNGARLEVKLCMTTPLPEKAGAESIDGSGSTSTAERNTQRYEDQGGQSVDTGTMRDDVWKEINSANKRYDATLNIFLLLYDDAIGFKMQFAFPSVSARCNEGGDGYREVVGRYGRTCRRGHYRSV